MPCWQLIAFSTSKYDDDDADYDDDYDADVDADDAHLSFIMIIFFVAIIDPIRDLCGPLCGRKSNVYQTPLLNIFGDKILHRWNISEMTFIF